MIEEIKKILIKHRSWDISTERTAKEILSLLYENTEVVSSVKNESSVYTNVGDSSASDVQDKDETLVEGALEIITDVENKFTCEFESKYHMRCASQCYKCSGIDLGEFVKTS